MKNNPDFTDPDRKVVIIGAGPAGLTAAYQLTKSNMTSVVIEKDGGVGGISRTVNYKGFLFDIGGHRFFTKVKAIQAIWEEMLSKHEFPLRPRLSRIYYNRTYFPYPLDPAKTLRLMGLRNSFLIFASYIKSQWFPELPEDNLERWVSNRFGKRLFHLFFKTYTEKVWGMPASHISADWAQQRIKDLSLFTAIKHSIGGTNRANQTIIKTLIDRFHYPQLGPGMMWQRVAEYVAEHGHQIRLRTSVEKILRSGNRVIGIEVQKKGRREILRGSHFISSMPLKELAHKFSPSLNPEVLQAANNLCYRDFLIVALIINQRDVFPDNWIYIHDTGVKVGRIQNFKNWSSYMVPDSQKTCLGLEYFCSREDELWKAPDQDLLELAKAELEHIGISRRDLIEDGTVVRMPKAYPIYDSSYKEATATVRQTLDQFKNFQVIGRNGMHKYNNQDHSMLTGMLAAKNIQGANYNLWEVNTEQEFYEEQVPPHETDSQFLKSPKNVNINK